nr:immunoglobulin heavy chain junction region [Mus musculus]
CIYDYGEDYAMDYW